MDPAPNVVTKEFAFFYTSIPDTNIGYGRVRGLFHLIYQRSGGPQSHEITFGCPAASAVNAAAFTPAAGPDMSVFTA